MFVRLRPVKALALDFDGVISDLYQGTCEMRDGSAPLQKGDDDSALPY